MVTFLPDLYSTLGADPSATPREIAARYRSAARAAHPDTGGSHEQFLALTLAWRILGDSAQRARFDALRTLQTTIESGDSLSMSAASDLVRRADDALLGWRVPPELRIGVAGLQDQARRWIGQLTRSERPTTRASTGTSSSNSRDRNDRSARDVDDLIRNSRLRSREYFVDSATRVLTPWSNTVARMGPGRTLRERRAALSDGYRAYSTLRHLQETLRANWSTLTDEDARLYYHVCRDLVTVHDVLIKSQSALGRSYSFKSGSWLGDQRRRAGDLLKARGLSAGDPPWPSPRSTPQQATDEQPSSAGSTSHAPSDSHEPADGSDVRRTTPVPAAGARPRRPAFKRRVAAGTGIAAVLIAGWLARRVVADALRYTAAAALIGGVLWVLVTYDDARRLAGACIIGLFKISWLIVRGVAAAIAALSHAIGRRT